MDSQVWLIIIGLGGYGILFLVAFVRCVCKSSSEEDNRVEVNIRFDCGIYIYLNSYLPTYIYLDHPGIIRY